MANKSFIITGPTSGIGRATALDLARHGTVILVGRDPKKLADLRKIIQDGGHQAVPVVCDLSDMTSVLDAAKQIVELRLPIAGLVNNAGILQMRPTHNALGWDLSFATNYLGPFVLTEALTPHLPHGANVVFVVSAVEDPERKPAVAAGFRGGRYISAEASARGEWQPGGAQRVGFDAYATSKQALLAATMAFAREVPRLRFNAVEPGLNPTTSLGDVNIFLRALIRLLVPLLRPFIKIMSTPEKAARVITAVVTDTAGKTGMYYDELGRPMRSSVLVDSPKFQDRVVAETREFLANWI